MTDEINMHSLVLMHYSITLTDGTVIENSFDDEPVEITMGKDEITDGMELAIYGLKAGDEQCLTLTAEQGFGLRDEDDVHDMPLSDFPDELPPETGLSYSFESDNGEEIPGTVVKVSDENATVDFNHPLAGLEIIFKVNILGINNAYIDAE